MKHRPHSVIVSSPQHRVLQYNGVQSTTRNVRDADLPLRFKVKKDKILFNNRALVPFANFLGRLNIGKSNEDDRESFSKFAYYCSKNRNILLSKWSAINSATQAFYRQVRDNEASRLFAAWVRKEMVGVPIVGEGYFVDVAVMIVEGENGFDASLPDLRNGAKEIHEDFHANCQEPFKSELLDAAKTWLPIRDEFNALFDEYEPVDVVRISRDCRPKKLVGTAFQAVSWMFY